MARQTLARRPQGREAEARRRRCWPESRRCPSASAAHTRRYRYKTGTLWDGERSRNCRFRTASRNRGIKGQFADGQKTQAISAGTKPSDRVHPEVVGVMKRSIDGDVNRARDHLIAPEQKVVEAAGTSSRASRSAGLPRISARRIFSEITRSPSKRPEFGATDTQASGEIVEAAGTADENARILEQIREDWWRRRESAD